MASSPTPGVILPTQTVVSLSSSAGFAGRGGGILGAPPVVILIRLCLVVKVCKCVLLIWKTSFENYPLEASSWVH
jgi:hypothetical protein